MTASDTYALAALAASRNLRDVGGHVTSDGRRVATGLVFRSAALGGLAPTERDAVAQLALRRVYDLRTAAEQTTDPDDEMSVPLVSLDVFGDAADLAPAQLKDVLVDPAQAAELLGEGRALAAMEDAYRRLVTWPSAHAAYRRLFGDLAERTTLPALFHCTAGKDRTGWAAAILLLVLGVPADAVMQDYLSGNKAIRLAFESQLDAFATAGGDPALLIPLFEVQPQYLSAALDEMEQHYGTVEGYLTDGLGLDADVPDALRAGLLL